MIELYLCIFSIFVVLFWGKIDLNIRSGNINQHTIMKFVVATTTNTFKVLFQNIKTFADDVVIHFGPEGLYMQGMDISMCCCFEMKLPVAWFESYEEADEEFNVGIATGVLQKILAVHRDSQKITLSVESDSDVLNISFTGGKDVLDTFFEIPLMEIEQDMLQFEAYESEVDLTIGSDKLSELVSQLKMFDDRVRIHFTDEAVIVEANGSEGSMRTDITTDDVLEYAIGEGIAFDQEYSLEFMTMIGVFKKLNPEFVIQFHRDRPLEGRYDFDGAFMKFFLAPKLSSGQDI